jgi:hypothetical protein
MRLSIMRLSIMRLSIMRLGIMRLSIMRLSIMRVSIMRLSIMKLSITIKRRHSVNDFQHKAVEQIDAGYRVLFMPRIVFVL